MYLDVHPCLSASYPALTGFPDRRAEQEVMKGREAKTKQRKMEASFMKKYPWSQQVDARQPIRCELILAIACDHKYFSHIRQKKFSDYILQVASLEL